VPGYKRSESLWRSVDVGPVHFVSYNTEAYFDGPINTTVEAQYAWLRDDLQAANANRHAVPWLVALGHRPFYCKVASVCADGSGMCCDGEQDPSSHASALLCSKLRQDPN
jgi:hypothetical protein